MTDLTKPVRREAHGIVREALIVTLYPSGILGLRAKHTRREYTLPLVTIYRLAIEAEVERKRAERAAKQGQRRLVSRGLLRR